MSPWAAYALLAALTSTFSGRDAENRDRPADRVMAGPRRRKVPDEGVTEQEARMMPLGEVMQATAS